MTNKEFRHLKAFEYANQHRMRPTNHPPSRRSAKAMATATGQWLRDSKIVSEISLEKTFKHKRLERGNIKEAIKLI